MTSNVVCVPVGTSVRAVAALLLEKGVSAAPVLAVDGRVVGMVSEGDLLGRGDADRLARRDWWLTLLREGRWPLPEPLGTWVSRAVEQVMRGPVVTIEARATLHEIAERLRIHEIKRLPVMLGDRMVGIVSRGDVVRAVASHIARGPPPLRGGLFSLFAGMMQTDVRPEDTPVAPSVPVVIAEAPRPTADAFRVLVTAAKEAERDDAIAVEIQAKKDHRRQVEKMLLEHLDNHVWVTLVERARDAAALGEKSFELFRFPCDVCSDGSRKIDVAEPDWPTTLRGEAAEIFSRWERELKPAGFGLTAQIVDYFDGMPGNVALRLTWSPNGGAD